MKKEWLFRHRFKPPSFASYTTLIPVLAEWRGVDADIENLVRNCHQCQLAAESPCKTELFSWPQAEHP
ncbi:unnamed protein product [Soboliphyme baturini]|uniref:Integrase_H2C2 domain-containing protein n=1 Tax=Soboliphyme baturini TaxID=241478 RepID=A0A183IZM5_9BILA|nr:unnamed protein product [Soboliphyme baturini]